MLSALDLVSFLAPGLADGTCLRDMHLFNAAPCMLQFPLTVAIGGFLLKQTQEQPC
jgi:hypothetical protein